MTPENLEAALRILRVSSLGYSFEYDLDLVRFLTAGRMWNISYAHSWVGYVGDEPAGLVLNAVDPPSREAYSLYWGVLPEFRGQGVLFALYQTYIGQLRREGYARVHGDAHADSPWPVFEKFGWKRLASCMQMECESPAPGPVSASIEVRAMPAADLAAWPVDGEFRCWTQTPAFFCNAGQFVEVLGAFRKDELQAYSVLTSWPGHTLLLDVRHPPLAQGAAWQIVRHLVENHYPAPFIAYMAPAGSAFHTLLAAAGFAAKREIFAIALDL